MFGELGDLDICGLNQGGGFNDPSEDANYSFDAQSDESASISDDYQDTFEQQAHQSANVQNEQVAPTQTQGIEPPKKNGSMIFMVALGLLLLTAAGLLYYKQNIDYKQNIEQASENGDVQSMGDYFYGQAAENATQETTPADSTTEASAQPQASEGMATVDVDLAVQQPAANKPEAAVNKPETKKAAAADEQKDKKQTMASVVIPVSSGGRPDPFYPYNELVKANAQRPAFDIVAPPRELPDADPLIDKLMEIKITGIMFDNVRPSALITVDGSEQLVHKGDMVTEYKVVDITKNKVVLKYKTNVFEVSAGQTMQFDGVHLNPVSSLSKQFGGAYTSTPKNIIQFN